MAVPEHRASDAEREATADRLRVAAGDGRLDPEELEERLEAAYAARTVGELAGLTDDLPVTADAPAVEGRRLPHPVRARLASFIIVNTICIAIWAASGAEGSFWPVWVLLGTGISLFASVVRGALGVEDPHEHRRSRRRRLEPPPPGG